MMVSKIYDTTNSHNKSMTSPTAEAARAQHFVKLTTTAKKLHNLFPMPHLLRKLKPSRWKAWLDDFPCEILLHDIDVRLASCLSSHLRAEFPHIPWPEDWLEFCLGDMLPDEIEVLPNLADALWLVSQRQTFLGTCPVCEGCKEHSEEPPAPVLHTQDVVEHFLQSRRGTVAKESLTSYRHTLSAFAKHCPMLPTTPEELETYFARFNERRSAAAAYSPIKQLYDFANERYGVPNAMKSVKRARYKEKDPYSFTLDEAKAVLNDCRNDRELGLIHLYLGHGLRLEEGCRTNIGDILDGQMVVRGKERQEFIPLLPETKEILLRLANGRSSKEPIFTGRKGRRLSHKMTYNVVKAILDRAGVTEGKEEQRIATHTLRKTFGTLATHAGCNDRVVKKLLRHKTADVTSLYISMPMDVLRDNLERYSPIRLLNGQSKEELHKIFSCSILQPPIGYPTVGKAIGFT